MDQLIKISIFTTFLNTFLQFVSCLEIMDLSNLCQSPVNYLELSSYSSENSFILNFDFGLTNKKYCDLTVAIRDDYRKSNLGIILTIENLKINDNSSLNIITNDINKYSYNSSNQDDSPNYHIVPNTINSTNLINIVIKSNGNGFRVKLIFTIFEEKRDFQCPPERSLTCKIGNICISNKFKCDGHNNCGNYLDEVSCTSSSISFPVAIIKVIIWVVAVLSFQALARKRFCSIRRETQLTTNDSSNQNFNGPINELDVHNLIHDNEPPPYPGSPKLEKRPETPPPSYKSLQHLSYNIV